MNLKKIKIRFNPYHPRAIFFALFITTLIFSNSSAQELNCTISVNAPQITNADKQVFETLKKEAQEFMNTRHWTNDQFLNQERIECSLIITISDHASADEFKGTVQVQTRRPVFNASYYTSLINFNDPEFNFHYLEFQPLEFNETGFTNSLTSSLAYYAYILIGLDYDSFTPNGGAPYFLKAQAILNNAQNAPEAGWKAFDGKGTRNRYMLVENLTNVQLKGMHDIYYRYHRAGLDIMTDHAVEGRNEIQTCLNQLKTINSDKPSSLIMLTFFAAKSDEIVNVFSEAPVDEKNNAFNILNELDPTNIQKYQKLTGGR